ncbi:MAG: tetratricopeptide repeat protein [Gammaproteobacteria bacterium]|nr:tetratricopeptide repeat protein [Gammaproteobacteria bacterium]
MSNPPLNQQQILLDYYNKGQFQQALDQSIVLLKKYPKSALIYNMLGVFQSELNLFDDSICSFMQSLKLIPGFPDALSNLAAAYNNKANSLQKQDKLDEAIKNYKNAIDIKSDYPEAYFNMGCVLQKKGELDLAIENYKIAIEFKNDYVNAYNNIGVVFDIRGELDSALEVFEKILSINPNDAQAHSNKGFTMQKKGDLDSAILSYRLAIKIKPDYADAYYNLGNAQREKGDLEGAIDNYKRTLILDPGYSSAKHLLDSLTGKTTDVAPRDYVENLFDRYASNFENSLVEELDYRTPKLVSELLIKNTINNSICSILDLGCGTGLVGNEVRKFCRKLVGIDLSELMLREARKKRIYDELKHVDILEYLTSYKLDFDIFVAADVFVYIGDLSEIFRLIKGRNQSNGKLLFSTEHNEKEGFILEQSGRYSHSRNYINNLCDKFGYQLLFFDELILRKEKDKLINGGIYLLSFSNDA